MAKYVILGLILGVACIAAIVFFGWKVLLVPVAISCILAPFSTSGKGDRNYIE